jgi:hypothetical protein
MHCLSLMNSVPNKESFKFIDKHRWLFFRNTWLIICKRLVKEFFVCLRAMDPSNFREVMGFSNPGDQIYYEDAEDDDSVPPIQVSYKLEVPYFISSIFRRSPRRTISCRHGELRSWTWMRWSTRILFSPRIGRIIWTKSRRSSNAARKSTTTFHIW